MFSSAQSYKKTQINLLTLVTSGKWNLEEGGHHYYFFNTPFTMFLVTSTYYIENETSTNVRKYFKKLSSILIKIEIRPQGHQIKCSFQILRQISTGRHKHHTKQTKKKKWRKTRLEKQCTEQTNSSIFKMMREKNLTLVMSFQDF